MSNKMYRALAMYKNNVEYTKYCICKEQPDK